MGARLEVHADCRNYRGDLPCRIGRLCWDCDAFAPWRRRRLVFGSTTGPFSEDVETTIVSAAAPQPLGGAPQAPSVRFLPPGWETGLRLSREAFDEVDDRNEDETTRRWRARRPPTPVPPPTDPPRHLIIKRGAMGDALRTTPLLRALREEGPCEVVWIADPDSCEVLARARHIDRLLPFEETAARELLAEPFDRVYALEKDPAACALSDLVPARKRIGFMLAPSGRVVARDAAFDETLRLGLDDDFKFRVNEKTVPQLTLEACGFPWRGEEYDFAPTEAERREAAQIASRFPSPWVGLNVGAGPRWPTKAWPEKAWSVLAARLSEAGMTPVLLGGPAERPAIERLAAQGSGLDGGGPYPIGVFAALLGEASVVVTGDTLALHLALAVRTPVVGLFCPTTPREIDFYGRGRALASPDGPCYKADCPRHPACFEKVTPGEVASAVLEAAGEV